MQHHGLNVMDVMNCVSKIALLLTACSASGGAKARALANLQAETSKRAKVDADVRAAVRHLLSQPTVLTTLQVAPNANPTLLSTPALPCHLSVLHPCKN